MILENRVFLGKLKGSALVRKFLTFYGTRKKYLKSVRGMLKYVLSYKKI
jgi:hypothetical protein